MMLFSREWILILSNLIPRKQSGGPERTPWHQASVPHLLHFIRAVTSPGLQLTAVEQQLTQQQWVQSHLANPGSLLKAFDLNHYSFNGTIWDDRHKIQYQANYIYIYTLKYCRTQFITSCLFRPAGNAESQMAINNNRTMKCVDE